MLPGLEIFYTSIANSLKTKNESIVALIHFILISNGYKCIGLDEKFEDNAQDLKGSEILPPNWNEKEIFILRYVQSSTKNLLLVKIIPSDTILLVNVLLKNNDQIYATSIDPAKLIKDDFKQFNNLFINDESLNNLNNEIKKEILDKLTQKDDMKSDNSKKEETKKSNLLIEDHSRPINPNAYVRPNINPSSDLHGNRPIFPQVGGADLDPLGRGIGGGMLMDLRSLQEQNRPRIPGGQIFDPSSGLERPLPPGSIPPGARFDPFGPSQIDPNSNRNRNRNRNHPDLEQFPPSDYDDMFM